MEPRTDEIQQVLNEAADLIEERGWCQGGYNLGAGPLSLSGAIRVAHCDDYLRTLAVLEIHKRVRARVAVPIERLKWDEAPGRTVDEVLNLLRGV